MKMNVSNRIIALGKMFNNYKIYPQSRYKENTALKRFQETHPKDHYALEVQFLLKQQDEYSDRIGADLPYWGAKYFSNEKRKRYFIIFQDSNSRDAGSIVFYANLMNQNMTASEVNQYIRQNELTPFRSWNDAKELLFNNLEIDINFVYLTDAKKVYPEGKIEANKSAEQRERQKWLQSETELSRQLIYEEIAICSPDIVIALGSNAQMLLNPNTPSQSEILAGDSLIQPLAKNIPLKNGGELHTFIYSPLPSGANRKYFNEENKLKVKKTIMRI